MAERERNRKKGFWASVKEQARANRTTFIVYLILWIAVLATMIRAIFLGNYEHVFLCILTFVLFMVPSFLERTLKIEFPSALEIIVVCFIFAAEILGEIGSYYTRVPFWDTLLHTVSGFLVAAVGFALVDILNRDEHIKFQLSPFYLALFAFCFALTIGVLWEFFELTVDVLLKKDMQKDTVVDFIYTVMLDPNNSNVVVKKEGIADVILVYADGSQEALGLGGYLDVGLYDTMEDMFVNFIGATVFSVIGYFYVKRRGKGKLASKFIPVLADDAKTQQKEEERDAPEGEREEPTGEVQETAPLKEETE